MPPHLFLILARHLATEAKAASADAAPLCRCAIYELRNPSPENVAYTGRLVDMAEDAIRLIEEVEADTSLWGRSRPPF